MLLPLALWLCVISVDLNADWNHNWGDLLVICRAYHASPAYQFVGEVWSILIRQVILFLVETTVDSVVTLSKTNTIARRRIPWALVGWLRLYVRYRFCRDKESVATLHPTSHIPRLHRFPFLIRRLENQATVQYRKCRTKIPFDLTDSFILTP